MRLRAHVTDASGKPIAGARARVLGHRFAIGDDNGFVVLDSLPGGSQTLEVRALGFVPLTKAVHLSAASAVPDTIALTSVKALLDTVRITTGRLYAADGNGFESRRKSGIGAYITRLEIDRLKPPSFVSLMLARPAFNIRNDPNGDQHIEMKAPWGGSCSPAVWIDGELIVTPAGPTAGAYMSAPLAKGGGTAGADAQGNAVNPSGGSSIAPSTTPREPVGILELNWLVRPEEIEGVELYRRPMEIPARFTTGGFQGCGAIVIWTRWRLSLSQGPPP
jgi:hypothetical protein